uniref:small monomeric GTPase n=2 Tax=Sinocyclocheilus rhinocerous TaxID=307959 RepID=A0A673KZF7_9TELE
MTIKSDLLQNDISTDAKPEALISEIAENERKIDTIPKQSDANIIPEVPHREEVHTKLSLNVQKRKMGSTRRPLKGNKGQRKVRVESEEKNGDNEVLSEVEDTETRLEIQNQDNVVDHNVTQEIMNIRDNEDEERKTTKTVDMSVQELCDDLELEQRPDVSQTQTGPSQDDTGSYLLEVPERTADFVRDRFACKSHSDLVLSDALLIEETQIHVSSEDVPPKEMVEMHPVSKRPMQKRKMGSTRKRGKRMVNDEEVEEEKEGEAENTTNDDGTTKSEENLTIEEAIVGYPVHQQLFSSSADKEGHEIQDIGSKSDVQTEISEQNDPNSTINPELLIESECSSNVAAEMVSDLPLGDADTYLGPKQSVIPKESLREDQSSLNPVVQKRKMGSTRKTLRGNKGQGKEVESKKMDRDSEEMTQEQDTEPHLATSARKTECKFDEEVEQNFPVEFSYPVASSKMFSESENGVKEVSPNIHDLSEVSEEKGMESTGNYSNSENKAINLYDGTKDKFVLTVSHEDVDQTVTVDYLDQHVYVGSEPEQTENTAHSFPTQELKNTQDDVVYEISSTQEKRRKMGSTRRYPRVMHGENMANNEDGLGVAEDRETNKAEDDLDDMPLASSISQSKEVSSVSTTDLESEILSSATDLKGENDHQNNSEPSGPTVPETPENTLQICDNQLVNADVTKHPQSETVTTEKRRKMGSTRKNLREGRIQGKRDGYEETETADTNLQMSQDSEMSLGEQTTHNYSNQSEDSLLREIERALNKTSQSSMSNDRESIVKEPNPEDLANASDLNMSENSEIKSLQPTPLAHSEPNSPGRRRRKMGSTRKNPREQLKAEREDEDKEDGEKDENLKTNKQENKDLERVEVSIVHNITENKLNKEYLDVSSAHTSSSQLEESTNPVSQERTSPSTRRKFGSRRAKGKQGLGSLAASDFGNELEDGDHKPDSSEVEDKLRSDDLEVCDPCLTLQPENQPITHPVSEQRNMEAKNEEAAPKGTGAGLVSLDQIMKHDRSTGAKQTVNLKNRISDAEVVQFNVVMVGNSCVGKTSFIRRFHEGQFTEDYHSTIGVDTCTQTVALPDRTVQLQIWDTAGQERFHSITTQVFHKADGLLLMYEITCSNSFISVRDWISRAQKRAPDDVIMMLLGNKNDSVERAVQIQEGADLAREYNIHFMECSAVTGANVSESMRTLAELLMQRKSQKERHTTLRREPSQKKSGCC